MINITRKTADLKLVIDGEKKVLTFSVDRVENYRAVVNMLKEFKKAQENELDDEVEQLDLFVSMIEGFRDTVKDAVGEKQYIDVFGDNGGDIPLLSWVAILQAMNKEYANYLTKAVSTEGEL